MLGRKQSEERQKLREQMDNELRLQREQMNNMVEANMKTAKQNRALLVQQNQDLQNKFLAVQKANEDNMKMIEKLSDLVAKQDEEKCRLSEQMELNAQNVSERQEEIRAEMEKRHKKEQEELRHQMETKIQDLTEEHKDSLGKREQDIEKKMEAKYLQHQDDLCQELNEKRERDIAKLKNKYQAAADARITQMTCMKTRMDVLEGELQDLKKPGFFKRQWSKLKALGSGVKDKCLTMWQAPWYHF